MRYEETTTRRDCEMVQVPQGNTVTIPAGTPVVITQALGGIPVTVYGDGSQTRSFQYISDLVDGLWRLMRAPVNEPGNLAASLLSLHFFWRSRPLQRLPRQRKARRRRHWSATA